MENNIVSNVCIFSLNKKKIHSGQNTNRPRLWKQEYHKNIAGFPKLPISENSDTEEAMRVEGNARPGSKADGRARGKKALSFRGGGGYLQNSELYYSAANLLHEQDKEQILNK